MAAKRTSNKLPLNLPQLQNCIKRDPSSYYEEFAIQYRHYDSILQILRYNSSHVDKDFESLIMFLAHVSSCYPKQMSTFPKQLMDLLRNYSTSLNRETRLACCRALTLMRSKSMVQPLELLPLFFDLCKCQDKSMRTYIRQTTISDIKAMNAHRRDEKVNKGLQRFMFSQLENHGQDRSAKLALDIMKELYRKKVWTDQDTVNQIAQACLSRNTKILVTALKFFLGQDEDDEDGDQADDSSDEDENTGTMEQIKDVMMSNKFNKKSRKREKMLTKVKQTVRKAQNKEKKVDSFNFSAIHLIHDPQGLAEKLMKLLEETNERFEVKLMIMNFISRLIGTHELILLNYYPLIQRYLQPHQMEVTKILQYTAQSAHKSVPPEELEPLLKTIAYNFVTERNSTEVMTVGLNSIRELCARAPLVMNEDLLQDLVQYQKYKNKNVSVAAKSLVYLFRVKNPDLLRRRDRGKPTIETSEFKAKKFGETDAVTFVPGTEALNNSASSAGSLKRTRSMAGLDEDDDMDDMEYDSNDSDVMDISDEDQDDDAFMNEEGSFEECSDEEYEDFDDDDDEEEVEVDEDNLALVLKKLGPEAARKKAEQISSERILTSKEVRRIQAAQLAKKMMAARPKRMTKKEEASTEVIEGTFEGNEKVRLGDIERLYKKSKHDKDSRLATVRDGREGREKYGKKKSKLNPKSSTSNVDKKKFKAFNMVKHKIKRKKKKKTFQEKQRDLKQQLINRAKNSK